MDCFQDNKTNHSDLKNTQNILCDSFFRSIKFKAICFQNFYFLEWTIVEASNHKILRSNSKCYILVHMGHYYKVLFYFSWPLKMLFQPQSDKKFILLDMFCHTNSNECISSLLNSVSHSRALQNESMMKPRAETQIIRKGEKQMETEFFHSLYLHWLSFETK